MTRLRFALLAVSLLLIFSACGEAPPDEPAVSASIGEYSPPETTAPETAEVTDILTEPADTEPEATAPPASIAQMKASEILALTGQLSGKYNTFTRSSKTRTEIEIGGERTERVSESTLAVKNGNAVFRRSGEAGEEEYHLVDSFLCFRGALGKYRIGGMSVSSFLETFSDQLPLGSFEEGEVEHIGGEIVLKFDKLSAQGTGYLREMLGLTDGAALEIVESSLEVRTDSNGHMSLAATHLSLTVSLAGEELMRVEISSEMRQNTIVGIVDLSSPSIADHILFPDLETIAYYETAAAQIEKFKSKRDAFEFTDSRSTRIGSDSVKIEQNSSTEYAYASRIGLSIDKRFDINDESGTHSLLTHYNNRRGFSQIDGGSIFVDTTVNEGNLFLMTFRPFDTAFYSLSDCKSAESVKDGRVTLTLKDSAVRTIARQIMLSSGVPCNDPALTKVNRAVTYIELDESGRLKSVGYELSLLVTENGKTYSVEQSANITVTSHDSATVNVIYIEVDEDEE